jgi:antitoxin PrlF
MSSTHVRAKGQITIPSDIRKAAHLEEGDPIELEVVEGGVLLKPRKVIDATQAWYWTPAWQAGEREAAEDLAAGRSRVFESSDDFLTSLDED